VSRSTAVQVRSARDVGPTNPRGRPAFDYKAWLSALLSHKNHQSAFKRALFRDTHPHFMTATKHAAAYAEGLPVQPTVDLTPQQPTQLTAQQLLEAIPRLVNVLPGDAQGKAKLLKAIVVEASLVE
jgi:hypothetical protein